MVIPGETIYMEFVDRKRLFEIFQKKSLSIEDQVSMVDQIKMLLLELLDHDDLKIPMMPQVARDLFDVIDKRDVSFDEISKIVERDQFMGGRLLKVANSPFYASRYPVGTIEDALKRLGLEEVKRILFTISISSVFVKEGAYHKFFLVQWRNALSTAFIAREIALMMGVDSSYSYMGALLHDIGATFVLIGLRTLEDLVGKRDLFESVVVEKLVSELHISMGLLIAGRWNLPGMISDAIRYHHSLDGSRKAGDIPLVVYSSAVFAAFFEKGEAFLDEMKEEPSLYFLGFSEEKIVCLAKEIKAKLEIFLGDMA